MRGMNYDVNTRIKVKKELERKRGKSIPGEKSMP